MATYDPMLGERPTVPLQAVPISLDGIAEPGGVLADRYEIRGRLGAGGMGVVFRAYDRELGEDVALKVIGPGQVDNPDALWGLRREVKMARKITHPNVCRVFDLGEDGSLRFLTMELVEGRSLRALLATGPLAPEHVRAILCQIADGVAAAHENGIVHRDIKPDNILLRDGGEAVLVDFGLAHVTSVRGSAVATAGTPSYMSPEQIRAEPLDARTDQFALAIVAYEMLTGTLPFGDGTQDKTLNDILHVHPRPLKAPALRPEQRSAIMDVIARALEKNPRDRFATIKVFITKLASALAPDMGARLDPRLETSFEEEELRGLRLVTRVRTVAVLILMAWMPIENSTARLLAIYPYVGAILLNGLVPLALRRYGVRSRLPLYICPLIDAALFVSATVLPTGFVPSDGLPLQMRLRDGNEIYLFALLLFPVFTYSPRVVLLTGAGTALFWGAASAWIVLQPDSVWPMGHAQWESATLSQKLEHWLSPYWVNPAFVGRQVLLALLFTGVIAAAVWRSRRIVLEQVQAERERAILSRSFSPGRAQSGRAGETST